MTDSAIFISGKGPTKTDGRVYFNDAAENIGQSDFLPGPRVRI
jgi:hypothetical protein